jgi:hypothetical protein
MSVQGSKHTGIPAPVRKTIQLTGWVLNSMLASTD